MNFYASMPMKLGSTILPTNVFKVSYGQFYNRDVKSLFENQNLGKPCIVTTWVGSDPSLGSIMLNSHIDVVPVFPDQWDHPPFSAHKTEDGWIYGRGTQDMKCVGIWYMEAIRNLKKQGFQPKRTIHVMWVPDEEIGGHDGMEKLIETDFFKGKICSLVTPPKSNHFSTKY